MPHRSSVKLDDDCKIKKLAEDFCNLPDSSFLRPNEIIELRIVGCSKATLYRKMEEGSFPRAKKLSHNIVGVRIGDIRHWLEDPSGWRVQNA